jgi:hypothetical protein
MRKLFFATLLAAMTLLALAMATSANNPAFCC